MRRFQNNKANYIISTLSWDISKILLKCPKCYITILILLPAAISLPFLFFLSLFYFLSAFILLLFLAGREWSELRKEKNSKEITADWKPAEAGNTGRGERTHIRAKRTESICDFWYTRRILEQRRKEKERYTTNLEIAS